MAVIRGMNHVGLAVLDLQATQRQLIWMATAASVMGQSVVGKNGATFEAFAKVPSIGIYGRWNRSLKPLVVGTVSPVR